MDDHITVQFKVPARFKVLFEPCLYGIIASKLFADMFQIYWFKDLLDFGQLVNRDNSHWFNGRTLPGPELDSSALEADVYRIIRTNAVEIDDIMYNLDMWLMRNLYGNPTGVRLIRSSGRLNDTVTLLIKDLRPHR